MTFPPLVVSGQLVSAAHTNALRNAIIAANGETYAWAANVAAGSYNLLALGLLTFSASGGFDDGTLSAPGLRFAADQNTGVRRSAADTVQVVCGGSAALTATASKVAIGASVVPHRTLSVLSASSDWSTSAAGGGGFSVGTGVGQTDLTVSIGVYDVGPFQHGWIQMAKPGTAAYPLMLNPLGGGVIAGNPSSAVGDNSHPNGTHSYWLDEVNHRLYFKCRNSSGVFKSGYVQLS